MESLASAKMIDMNLANKVSIEGKELSPVSSSLIQVYVCATSFMFSVADKCLVSSAFRRHDQRLNIGKPITSLISLYSLQLVIFMVTERSLLSW